MPTPDNSNARVSALEKKLASLERIVTFRLLGNNPASVYVSPSSGSASEILITGLTWTDNSPVAGSIAWSAFTIINQGNVYAIAAGNTALANVWWVLGDSALTAGAAFTAAADLFLISVNTAGVHSQPYTAVYGTSST